MPTLPSFASWGPRPNLAGAFGSGVDAIQAQQKLAHDADRIMLEAQQIRNDYQIKRQQLAAEQQMAAQANAVKLEIAGQNARESEARLAVEKAYQNAGLALRTRALDEEVKARNAGLAAKAEEAARSAARTLQIQTRYKALRAGGMSDALAYSQALMELGEPNAAAANASRMAQPEPSFDPTTARAIPIPGAEGHAYAPLPGGRMQIVPRTSGPKEGTLSEVQRRQVSQLEARIRTLQRLNDEERGGTGKRSPAYQNRASEIDELTKRVEELYRRVTPPTGQLPPPADYIKPMADFGLPSRPLPGESSKDQTPSITTKAEFDALPAGATYRGKDGKLYRKP